MVAAPPQPRRGEVPAPRRGADEGCTLSPTCDDCPFPDCLSPRQAHVMEMRARARELRASGLSGQEIAATMGLSRRYVWRLLSERAGG